MNESFQELLQWLGLLMTAIGAGVSYGKTKQKVESLEESQKQDRKIFLTKDGFEPFAAEVLRRLKRIEQKQDDRNGRDKP